MGKFSAIKINVEISLLPFYWRIKYTCVMSRFAKEASRRIRLTSPGKVFEVRANPPGCVAVRLKLLPDGRHVTIQKTVMADVSLRKVRQLRKEAGGGEKAGSGRGVRVGPGDFHVVAAGGGQDQQGVPAGQGLIAQVAQEMGSEPQMRFIDKVSFTLGVLILCLSEFLAVRRPDLFPDFFRVLMTLLLLLRLVTYTRNKAQFFLIDFCYFTCASCGLQTHLAPEDDFWFRINFVCALGPLAMAIPVWRNSLVFHSLDKMTSFFLHGLPAVLMTLFRFGFVPEGARVADPALSVDVWEMAPSLLGIYVVWQSFYLFVTEVAFRQAFVSDKELTNSLRHMTRDERSMGARFIKMLGRTIGVYDPDESLNPDDFKTKVLFVITQFLYTVLSLAPTPWVFKSFWLALAYLGVIFLVGTWNGASFYIDVFSKTYIEQFAKKPALWFFSLFSRTSRPARRKPSADGASSTLQSMQLEKAVAALTLENKVVLRMLDILEEELSSGKAPLQNNHDQ